MGLSHSVLSLVALSPCLSERLRECVSLQLPPNTITNQMSKKSCKIKSEKKPSWSEVEEKTCVSSNNWEVTSWPDTGETRPTLPSTPTTRGPKTQRHLDSELKSKLTATNTRRLLLPNIEELFYHFRCRLSKDSLTGWDCCSLTLQPCRTPLVSPQVSRQIYTYLK